MAGFTLNINERIVNQYSVTESASFQADACDAPISKNNGIGLIKETETISPSYYLLTAYSDSSSWKTVKLKNIVYSNPFSVYLSESSGRIPESGSEVYNVDVAGQEVDLPISGFFVTFDGYDPVVRVSIDFDLSIENLNLYTGAYTHVKILISYEECSNTSSEDMVVTTTQNNSCGLQDNANVIVPSGSSRYVVVTSNDSFGSTSSTTAGETITVDTIYNLIINAADSGTPYTESSSVVIKVYNDDTKSSLIAYHQIDKDHQGITC